MTLDHTIYIIEERNKAQNKPEWLPRRTSPFTKRGTVEKALKDTKRVYGHNGQEYRIATYKRTEP